jgi:HD-GYP domain-containing protein (c-di-GMP phosphodiesterase class II)
MGSRIMAVADAFEAMICHRPYRKPLPFRMAVSEIRRQSAGQFDPAVVDAFIRIADSGKLEELIRNHRNEFKRVF